MLFDGPVPSARQPVETSSPEDVIATVAVENQASAITLARAEMLSALPWVVLAAAVAVVSIVVAAFRGLALPAGLVLVWSIGRIVRYCQVVHQDPVRRWRREIQENHQLSERRDEFELRSAAARPRATPLLIGLVSAVTAIEFFSGGVRGAIPAAALVKPAVRAGEWWRLLSAAYLHGSLMHVLANMTSLWSLGRLVETYERPSRVPLVFLVSALGCSLLSTMLLAAPSLGASGGVIGLVGYLLVVAGLRPDGVPRWFRGRMAMTVLNVAIIGIAGYRYIDNAGHAGGLLAGGMVGYVLRSAPPADTNRRGVDLAGFVSMSILLAGAVFTTYRLIAF